MEVVNLEEAAKILNINMVLLLQYIDAGNIKATKIDEDFCILKSELERFSTERSRPDPNFEGQQTSKKAAIVPAQRSLFSRRPPARHRPIFPGISSTIMEAIVEMSQDIQLFSELKSVISEHAKDCLSLLERIESEGISDPNVAIDLLLLDEAARNLSIRRSLFVHLLERKAIVLLPLPPHLSDMVLGIAQHDRVFTTDKNLPPHLKHSHYLNVDFIPIAEIERLAEGIEAVVLEGYIEHNSLYIRDTASNIVYILGNKGLKEVFIHSIPHIPPHSRFIQLHTNRSSITVTIL